MKTPKELFLEDHARAVRVADIIADPDVQAAITAAFTNLCWNLPGSANPQNGWNANCVRDGAKRLVEELNSITKRQVVKPIVNANLEPAQ